MAILIGGAIGLQREHHWHSEAKLNESDPQRRVFAGARTFSLVSLAGFAGVVFHKLNFIWVLPAIFVACTIFLAINYWRDSDHPRITSEITLLLTLLLGALCGLNMPYEAVFIMILILSILSLKDFLNARIKNLKEIELNSMTKFLVISAVVLPLLPREIEVPAKLREFMPRFPFEIFSPYQIWMVVVLISGIGLVGYILNRILGGKSGILLTGIAGGLVSSTAVSMNFSRHSKVMNAPRLLAAGILLASIIMYPRVLMWISLFDAQLLSILLWPFVFTLVGGAGFLIWLILRKKSAAPEEIDLELGNPFSLKEGLMFAAFYIFIRIIVYAARLYLGDWGIYSVALISGLTDVDAVTISITQAVHSGGIAPQTGAIAIFLATVSNAVTKAGIVIAFGSRPLAKYVIPAFLILTLPGLVVLLVSR